MYGMQLELFENSNHSNHIELWNYLVSAGKLVNVYLDSDFHTII